MALKLRDFIDRGACTEIGPEFFFGDPNDGPTAKGVCDTMCSVQADCLRYALEDAESQGIWGGTDIRQREAMRAGRLRVSPR